MGRMALFSDNKGKVALAKTARDHAVIALEKAPQMDLAHHLMGRSASHNPLLTLIRDGFRFWMLISGM